MSQAAPAIPPSGKAPTCQPLIEAAHLNIYRENAFRITGLAVDASAKEVARHADKLRMMEELGHGRAANQSAFAPYPPPSVDQIREAMQRLRDPEKRLIDEFFWFWPESFGTSANDLAIQALMRGDASVASDTWAQRESDPENGFIATHNIAVLFHLIALDWTLYHIASEVNKEQEEKIKGYWQESLKRWEQLFTGDRVWYAMESRICLLDDPRLPRGFAHRVRHSFPEALHKINAEAALGFAEEDRADWARIHIGFIKKGTISSPESPELRLWRSIFPDRDVCAAYINGDTPGTGKWRYFFSREEAEYSARKQA